jgi:hypothetical protein
MACADDAKASAKATAIGLIIRSSPVQVAQSGQAHQPTSGPEAFDLDQQMSPAELGHPSTNAVTKSPLRLARHHWA